MFRRGSQGGEAFVSGVEQGDRLGNRDAWDPREVPQGLGHVERRHPDGDRMSVHVVPLDDILCLDRSFCERESPRPRLSCQEILLALQRRAQVLRGLDDGHDEVVDLEVNLFPHLLDAPDDLPGVGLGLQLGRDPEVEVQFPVVRRHADDLIGHRLLEPDHGGIDRDDLALDADLELPLLQRLLDLLRRTRLEELHDLRLQHFVRLADRRGVRLHDDGHPRKLLGGLQHREGLRIGLLEADPAERLEGLRPSAAPSRRSPRGLGRSPWTARARVGGVRLGGTANRACGRSVSCRRSVGRPPPR